MNFLIIPGDPLLPDAWPQNVLVQELEAMLCQAGYPDIVTIETNNGWHPVSEDPPDDGEYLVFLGKLVDIGLWSTKFGWNTWTVPQKKPTHWQSMPLPPEST